MGAIRAGRSGEALKGKKAMKLSDEELKNKNKQTVKVINQISKSVIAAGSANECLSKRIIFDTKNSSPKIDSWTRTGFENCHGREVMIGSHYIKKFVLLRLAVYPFKNMFILYTGFYSDDYEKFKLFVYGLPKSATKPSDAPSQQMPNYIVCAPAFLNKFVLEKHRNSYAGVYLEMDSNDDPQDHADSIIEFYRMALGC